LPTGSTPSTARSDLRLEGLLHPSRRARPRIAMDPRAWTQVHAGLEASERTRARLARILEGLEVLDPSERRFASCRGRPTSETDFLIDTP
jgi:hypothetical protein